MNRVLRLARQAFLQFICRKVWNMFVINKFYYYFCKENKGEPKGLCRQGDPTKPKLRMTSSLYIISLILVVLRR